MTILLSIIVGLAGMVLLGSFLGKCVKWANGDDVGA
jgi:hypothetical protein